MSIWVTIPSKRPAAEVALWRDKWRERGYRIALLRDYEDDHADLGDVVFRGTYLGYAFSVNYLIKFLIANVKDAEWFIAAGDDVEPDLAHSADEIAAECRRYFRGERIKAALRGAEPDYTGRDLDRLATFGVMQPTGDRWGDEPWARQRWPEAPAYIDRICGSAWIGREFARRMYGGNGPLWGEYFHMYVDEELQNVAKRLGVLWQRPDLTQLHQHWGRKQGATTADIPAFLQKANSAEAWQQGKAIFDARLAAGFPGHEPIP